MGIRYIFILFLSAFAFIGCRINCSDSEEKSLVNDSLNVEPKELLKRWNRFVLSGEYDSLVENARPYFEYAVKTDNEKLKSYVAAYMGQAFILQEEPDSMLYYFSIVAPYAERENDRCLKMILANGLAINARNTTINYNIALAYFQEALSLASQEEDKRNYLIILSNMSQFYFLRKDESGLKYALEVYNGGVVLKNKYVEYLGAINSASMYYICKDYKKALHMIERAYELADANRITKDGVKIVHASILSSLQRDREAENLFKSGISQNNDSVLSSVFVEGCQYYGRFLFDRGRYDEALVVFQRGLVQAERQRNYHFRYWLYKDIADVYAKLNNRQVEREYQYKCKSLYDSIFNVEQERSFSKMILAYETSKAERIISNKELEISEKNRYLQMLVFGVVVILLILVFIYVLYIRKRRMYRQLVQMHEAFRTKEQQLINRQGSEILESAADRQSQVLFEKLEKLMAEEKLYRRKDVSLEMLVERLETNRTYLSKMFSNQETSFASYINSYRIKEALSIFSQDKDDLPLKTLADMLGYNSLSSFYRAFQKETGVPPSKYRLELKKMKN